MKVLIVYDEAQADNLFVPVLCRAIREQKVETLSSREEFWKGTAPFDIIHFQWPEEVVGWNCSNPAILEKLKQRIAFYQALGARFVYTRHNQCPHYANEIIAQAYTLIETCTDVIVHMGQYSYNELCTIYPRKCHLIIPHHVYENTYNENISREDARQKLNIPLDRFVITTFGKFRKREESGMVLSAYLHTKIRHKYLLAPRLYPITRHPQKNILKKIAAGFLWHLFIPVFHKICSIQGDSNEKIVPNEELPYYLAASDLIFIQRMQILNSGNVPLAFLFSKVVIGPDCGNVGEMLRETGNPVFNPEIHTTIKEAIEKAFLLNQNKHGEDNHRYALQYLNLKRIGEMYAKAYKELYHP